MPFNVAWKRILKPLMEGGRLAELRNLQVEWYADMLQSGAKDGYSAKWQRHRHVQQAGTEGISSLLPMQWHFMSPIHFLTLISTI